MPRVREVITIIHRYNINRILGIALILVISNRFPISAQVSDPYHPLHGGAYTGASVAGSPDPLVNYRWPSPAADDSLQVYRIRPKTISMTPGDHFRKQPNGHEIMVEGIGDIRIDFGQENAGWLEFETDEPLDSVTASISEYNEPAIVNAGAEHRFKTAVPVRYGHTYRLELNKELYEGVRFAWIHIHQFTKTARIKSIRLVCQTRPVNYQGSFSSSDTMLTRIWYTGAYTVRLNLLQDYFGDILMERSDRHSWTGDAYPAQAAALAAFGNYDMVRKNLAFTSGQDNGIAAYSLYWVLSLIDYYRYTADTSFIKSYLGNVDNRLQKAYDSYDSLPPLNFMGWDERLGAGFENSQTKEAQETYRMLCISTWRAFAKVMSDMHENARAEKYRQFARSKVDNLMADRAALNTWGVHAVSEAIKAGLGDNPTIKKLADQIYADPLKRLSYSPFNQYFILQAMGAGKYDEAALQSILDIWGGQILYGGTTFFEVYRPSWNAVLGKNDPPPNNQCGYTSLCHPWSAGVTKWLSENIAGIKPVTAGFRHFEITPDFGHHLKWVKGTMPTPYGSITANFNIETGNCLVIVPEGTTGDKVVLPKAEKRIGQIKINGQIVYQTAAGRSQTGQTHTVKGIASCTVRENTLTLNELSTGKYAIQVIYENNIPQNADQITAGSNAIDKRFPYKASFEQDSITQGHWMGHYGSEGYRLLGLPESKETEKLPDNISSIDLHLEKTLSWNPDNVKLPTESILETSITKPRMATAIATQDPIACRQTMTIDVKMKKPHKYSVSIYFLDGDQQNRTSALELFDLETKEIIAPVAVVRHYGKGKYIRFTYDRSFRLRINQVRGENAVVSGIFFDEPIPVKRG